MTASDNPYASPLSDTSAEKELTPAPADVEELRHRYLTHEAAIRAVGGLYYLGGAMMGLGCLAGIVGPIVQGFHYVTGVELLFLLFYSVLTIIAFVLGAGLRRLDGRVRIPVIVVSVLGLIQIPFTLLHIYVLYLMFSSKAKMVFSPQYRTVIEQTPYIRYKTSRTTWTVLILAILLAVLAVGLMVYFG